MARRKGQRGTVVQKGKQWWGRYYADVPGQKARPRRAICIGSVEAMNKTQAKRRLHEMLGELGVNTAEHLERSLEPLVTFAQRADRWIRDVEDSHSGDSEYGRVKPSTFRSMKSIIEIRLKPCFGDMAVDEIAQKHTDTLIDDLAAKGKSKATIKNVIVTLGVVLGRTFQTKDKMRNLKSLKPKASRDGLWFTGEQMRAIIGEAQGRAKALFATAAGTGMRAGELFGLRVEDVDLRSRTITVRRSVWEGQEQSPKSENAYRIIGIDRSVVQLLREWIGERRFGYVFPSRNGTPLREGNVVERNLWPILDKLKLLHRGLHAFRHGRVTVLVEAGVPIHTIKAWLGHGSEKMVELYTHSRPAYHQKHLKNVPMVLLNSPNSPNSPKFAVQANAV